MGLLGEIIVAAAVVCTAALVQGVVGFAFGILGMPCLTLLWDARSASVVLTLLALGTTGQTLWSVRDGIRLGRVVPIIFGVYLGLPVGVAALVNDDAEPLLRYLVALVCLMGAAQNWLAQPPPEGRGEPHFLVGLLVGFATGFLSGSVSSSAPPLLWYIYRRPWTRNEWKATALAVFGLSTVSKLGLWLWHDTHCAAGQRLLTGERITWAVCLVPLVFCGTTLGIRLFTRVDRELLRKLVCVILAAMAAVILATNLVAR